MDELMEILTLKQTDKIDQRFPMLLYGSSYWKSVINFEKLLEFGVIDKADLDIFSFVDSPQAAFEYLRERLTNDEGSPTGYSLDDNG